MPTPSSNAVRRGPKGPSALNGCYKLKPSRQCQPHRQRLCRMHMPVRHAADRLARQPRQIVIFDLVGFRVEEIEYVEMQPQTIVELVTRARIEDQRCLRTDAVILDQGTRAEIASTERAEPAALTDERHAASHHTCRRPRN